MAVVVVNDVQVLNPTGAAFTDNFQFEITFECTAELKEDIEWKVVYVGSAEDQNHDQELEAIMVGPLPVGKSSNYHIHIYKYIDINVCKRCKRKKKRKRR